MNKEWGETNEIFNKNNVSIHRIIVKKDFSCSKHKHDFKYNVFYIEAGKLIIQIWKSISLEKIILETGQFYCVPPCFYHKFTALEDTTAYEIYYSQLEKDDIHRIEDET